ncbi:AAA family ATPase [Zhongshania sp.]|uniref:AAA family ATPase n=1 Tax=Zhongshania sp. TaxID=1971902 RepID=UPI0035634E31
MSSSILINQLIVVGTRKNYAVNFNAGVNIIYGDSATGKSSILDLIDYLLGAKKFDLYPEIHAAARYAVLDVTLNEDRYSIKRDIFDASRPIEVYPCAFADIEKFAAKKYLPTFKTSTKYPDMEFFSEFLLSALNLTNLKIKQAPTRDDSKLVRLSFRDLIHYCYVNQDDLGSKKYFKPDNFSLQVKNAEVFKYIFNALDCQISELEQDISDKSQRKSEIEKKFTLVSEFLRESEFGSMLSLDDEVTKTDNDIALLKEQIGQINGRLTADNEVYRAVKSSLDEIELEKNALQQRMLDGERKVERFTRLHNDYLSDIAKFNSSLEARSIIGEIPEEIAMCPVCDGALQLESAKKNFDIAPSDKIKYELNSLKRRVRDTEQLINDSKSQWERDKTTLKVLEEDEKRARELLDQNTKELVSPYLAERDMHVKQLGELNQKRAELVSRLKIRNQHSLLTEQIKSLEISIRKLKEQVEKLKENAPSMADVLSNLADNLQRYLSFIKIKDPTGVSYTSDKFVPMLRGIEYGSIRSGGLRTIVGIGYLCSLMEEALTTQMSYPSFLMIDTVGKYLGKTKAQSSYQDETSSDEDFKEGVSDPQKYQNIFEHIISLSNKYEQNNQICQFILVDNDVPDHIIGELSGFIVAQFSSERVDGLPVGFIDDAPV